MDLNENSTKSKVIQGLNMAESSTEEKSNNIETTFTETFDQFLIFAEKVLQYDTGGDLKLTSNGGQTNGLQLGLNGYRVVYNKTRDSPKHMEKFKEVYQRCRPNFLKEVSLDVFMDWFEKSTSFIITPQEKSRNKIYLTVIFRNCVRIAEHIADEAEKNPNKSEQLLNDPAAVYPEHFMLYLFRLFYHCADQTDRQTMLIPRIQELEKNLGLRKDEVPIMSDGFSEIFSTARDIAQDIGINIPKNAPGISGTQFKDVLKQFAGNQETKNALKGLFSEVNINDPKEIPNAIGKLLNKMSQTASTPPEAIQKANNATADNIPVVSNLTN